MKLISIVVVIIVESVYQIKNVIIIRIVYPVFVMMMVNV